jgi:osmotically-inducible protein OsmY
MTRRACLLIAAAAPLRAATQEVSDDVLYDMVRRRLANDAEVKGGTIEVEVQKGVVTLKGSVDTTKQRDRAEKLVKNLNGVRKVNNQLAVARSGR